MKFTVSSNELLNAVSKAITVTPTRNNLPLLNNINISLEGKELTILGTDLDCYAEIKMNVDGKSDGQIALPAKKFETLLTNLSNKELTFDVQSGYKTIIKTKGGKWTITGENPDEFPTPYDIDYKHELKLSSALINHYLPKAMHAATTDELRRSMNGVLFEISDAGFRLVSTDGHRLVKLDNNDIKIENDKVSMLIPIKTCNILTKLIKSKNISSEKEDSDSTEGDFPIFIYFSNETVKIAFRNITIYSRLIDETFPNYESVIPTDNEKILKVNRKQLIDSLKRSIVMSDQITNRTTFKINENQVKVFAANTEVGTDAEESIECTFTESDEFEISFNGKYLLEAVEQIDSEDILFDFNTPHKASILRPSEQQENENLIILVMPVRSL